MKLRLATRGSALALHQTSLVGRALERAGVEVEVRTVRTTGDRETGAPLASLGATGLFTTELDRLVADREADAAVHSLKDLPTVPAEGLRIVCVLEREDPRDAFVHAPGRAPHLHALPERARVGTSSLRRRALLLEQRPDLDVVDLRGNLDTRIRKIRDGECDAAILARAGLRRLSLEREIGEVLEAPPWLPAAGQGAIAVVARADAPHAQVLAGLDHRDTRFTITAERAFLRTLRGGCQVPVGAFATIEAAHLTLHGLVASVDGRHVLRGRVSGEAADADAIGERLAGRLLREGAEEILASARYGTPPVSAP